MDSPLSVLEDVVRDADGFVELRYHAKQTRTIAVEKGRVERTTHRRRAGVGVRVKEGNGWGFASTGSLEAADLRAAIDAARAAARASAEARSGQPSELAAAELARGHFDLPGVDDVLTRPLDEKIGMAADFERTIRSTSPAIVSATCAYNEIYEEKAIVTTDGAAATFRLVRPELRLQAVAEKDGELSTGFEAIGTTGGWECLFRSGPGESFAEKAARKAVDLLHAGRPEGGRATVILAPSIVGLLVHEAIGHTVEADFVQAGSVAAGKLGQRVASELVTLCDSGASELSTGAGGCIPVDDEGVVAGRTTIIDQGILVSYLHNRESAARFEVKPTGNARAWEYSDQPLIRMRNTYMVPGTSSLEEMIATTKDGYLLDGPRNGQADATGEFMFGVQEARRIRNGKLGELVRGVTISGIAFDVLKTVDAVSNTFAWELGSGYCGKGQPAKVDAGGPYIRCQVLLGGEQA
ncbi:MAG: TldD/PmbA family protein [Deltaproteobacteria bacterium]|nr:MAG: TldD/PmbA family protein [Deltaproteobacteria bacterium]